MPAFPTHQSFTARDSKVIAEAVRRRRQVLVLKEDEEWLLAFSDRPRRLLRRMSERGALKALGGGRYVITQPGKPHLLQAAPWQVILDGEMHPYGPYYLGFLSALVEHHLTDIESPTIYVAVQRASDITRKLTVTGREVRIRRYTDEKFWFGVEPVRISRSERYYRSDLERTLVDCLHRPAFCGSPEIYILGWARALRSGNIDVEKLCGYSLRLSAAAARRAGFLLSAMGHGEEAKEHLASVHRPPGGSDRFDASLPEAKGAERDTDWGLSMNVPRAAIEGFLAYGK